MRLFRFIDDGLLFHPESNNDQVAKYLKEVYPPNLTITFVGKSMKAHIPFLDVLILTTYPLRTTIYYKASNSCSYIPWKANVPRHIKVGWVKGELIRYLRVCSEEYYFECCAKRLEGAIRRLGYPQAVWKPLPLTWADRHRYLVPKRDKGKRGRDGKVHAFRIPFHASLPICFSRIVHSIRVQLVPCIPTLQIFTVFRPLPSLKSIFNQRLRRSLRSILPEIANAPQAQVESGAGD